MNNVKKNNHLKTTNNSIYQRLSNYYPDKMNINTIMGSITFIISFSIYLSTMAPTTSFWDCGEFIATSVTMGVPHPPGTPLYLLLGNFFSQIPLFTDIGARVNLISVIVSAFAVMFVYLISVQIIEEWRGISKTTSDKIINYGSSFIGALTFAVTDSHWFNAVEAEVYSLSTFFTAIVVWLILKWSREHDQPGNYRYLLIIAYILGLATALHLLNLLALPFIGLIIYFKKYKSSPIGILIATLTVLSVFGAYYWKIGALETILLVLPIIGLIIYFEQYKSEYIGLLIALICSSLALLGIYFGIIKGLPNLFDQLFNKIPYFGLESFNEIEFNSNELRYDQKWSWMKAISTFFLPLFLTTKSEITENILNVI